MILEHCPAMLVQPPCSGNPMRTPLCAALLALPISLAAQDPGLLAGTVVDELLRPVAGAVVDCRPVPGGALPDVTIRDERTAPPTLRSDANGEFRFMVPANGPWQLRATMPPKPSPMGAPARLSS